VVDSAAAFLGSETAQDRQGRVLGNLQSAVAAGSLVGPLIGGFLVRVWGFRPLLIVMGILTGICAITACALLQERRHQAQASANRTGIVQTFKTLFYEPKTRAFVLAGICAKIGIFGLVTAFAPFVKELVDASTSAAATWVGMLQAATWGATFFGSAWWGKQNDRRAVEWNYIWASLLCGLSVVLQVLTQQIAGLFIFRILQGFFFSALIQSVFLIVVRTSNDQNRSVRIGATNSSLIVGQVLGSFSGGLLGGIFSIEGVFISMGFVFMMGGVRVWLNLKHPTNQNNG
jgi:MFS family permease